MKRTGLCTGLAVCAVLFAGASAAPQAPGKSAPPKESTSGDSVKGKAVYAQHCEICHYAQAEAMKMAPGLKGIYKKGKYADGKKVDDASMRAWIEKGGPKMPPFRDTLTPKQLTDLVAYIRTL